MPVSGFMIARAVMRCSNPRRGIAAYIAPMARLPVHRYRKEMAAVRLRQKTKKGLGKRYITPIIRITISLALGLSQSCLACMALSTAVITTIDSMIWINLFCVSYSTLTSDVSPHWKLIFRFWHKRTTRCRVMDFMITIFLCIFVQNEIRHKLYF